MRGRGRGGWRRVKAPFGLLWRAEILFLGGPGLFQFSLVCLSLGSGEFVQVVKVGFKSDWEPWLVV